MATPLATINDNLTDFRSTQSTTGIHSTAPLLTSDLSQRGSVTNPNKTQLIDPSLNRAAYDIRVNFDGKRPITIFRHLNSDGSEGDIFGRLEWHDVFPDQMSFMGAKTVRKTSFFSKAGAFGVVFRDDMKRKYTWKGLGSGLQLELHAEDNFNPETPIARFQKTRLDYSTEPATAFPASLYLAPRAMEIKELVIFTFFVLEKVRRTNENSSGNKLATENLTSRAPWQ
ncbi:hypothetical protein FRB98_004320 [Tulasnella sp. 332]|nr:hypothetical protein FRB98_004320 [Tulasnella sp. 332]